MRLISACPLVLACALLAGCSGGSPGTDATDAAAGAPANAAVGSAGDLEAPVVEQDPAMEVEPSRVELLALTEAQLGNTDLPGELACAFADAKRGTLLVARADVLPDGAVHGVLSDNGYTAMLADQEAGGFNDLLDGITLTGKDLTVVLRRGARHPTGDESTRHAATLAVERADGAERRYQGTWTCGP